MAHGFLTLILIFACDLGQTCGCLSRNQNSYKLKEVFSNIGFSTKYILMLNYSSRIYLNILFQYSSPRHLDVRVSRTGHPKWVLVKVCAWFKMGRCFEQRTVSGAHDFGCLAFPITTQILSFHLWETTCVAFFQSVRSWRSTSSTTPPTLMRELSHMLVLLYEERWGKSASSEPWNNYSPKRPLIPPVKRRVESNIPGLTYNFCFWIVRFVSSHSESI